MSGVGDGREVGGVNAYVKKSYGVKRAGGKRGAIFPRPIEEITKAW